MSALDNASKVGKPNQNLVLETAGRIWIKVQDRFYELDFRDQNKSASRVTNVVNNNITETAEEPDMSQYVTKNYLKSTLTEYVTKRAWADVKETTTMLENSMLEGFTESISPITVNTMQVVVGADQLQYDFIRNYNNDEVIPGGFISQDGEAILTQYHVKLTGGWIKHYTIDGPSTVRAVTAESGNKNEILSQYCRWHIVDEEFDLSDSAYYVYIKVPKLTNLTEGYPERESGTNKYYFDPSEKGTSANPLHATHSEEEALYYKTNQRDGYNQSLEAHYVVSASAIEMETDEDTDNYYLLFAIINSPNDDGSRSYVTMNGFTEITPGRVTAYRFMSPDGVQYLNFLDKSMHLGDNNSYLHFDADTGELRLKGTIVQSPSGAEFPVPCYRGEFSDEENVKYYYGDSVTYNGEVWLDTFNGEIGYRTLYGVVRPGESIIVNGRTIYPWILYSSKAKANFLSTVFTRTIGQPTTPTGGDYSNPIPIDTDTYGNLIWSDGIPTDVEGTSLWMSQRLFTEDGNYPQDDEWTTPVAAMDGADIDFEWSESTSTDPGNPDNPRNGAIWTNNSTPSTVWMAVRKKSNGVWSNWQVSKIKGEKGDKGDSPITADLTDEMTGIMVGEDGVLQGDSSPIDFTAHLYYGNDAQTITKIRFSNPNNKIEVGVPGSGSNVITTNPNTSINNNSPTIRIKVKDGWTASTVKIGIELYCIRNGVEVSASCTHTIVGVKEGQDGHLFKLLANPTEIIFNDPDDTSTQNVTCNAIVISPKGEVSTTTLSGSKFYYTVYGTPSTSRREYTLNTNVPVSVNNTKVEFEWEIPYNNNTIVIDRESVPVLKNGKNGLNGFNTATLYLYRRHSTALVSADKPNTKIKYDFDRGIFYDPETITNNIQPIYETVSQEGSSITDYWWRVIPSSGTSTLADPVYITYVTVRDNTNTVTIEPSDWSDPQRLTYNGLQGKIMRGVNQWSADGLTGGGLNGNNGYLGMEDHNPDANGEDQYMYYDIVYYGDGANRRYYYCSHGYVADNTKADQRPDYNNSQYWVQADQFNFVATNVLLANSAHIDVQSGNALYMKGTINGNECVVAGVQGGTDINFFAGTQISGVDDPRTDSSAQSTISNAPFRVSYDGNVFVRGAIDAVGENYSNPNKDADDQDDTYKYAIRSQHGLITNGNNKLYGNNEIIGNSIVEARDYGTGHELAGVAYVSTKLDDRKASVQISTNNTGSPNYAAMLFKDSNIVIARGSIDSYESIVSSPDDIQHLKIVSSASQATDNNTIYFVTD